MRQGPRQRYRAILAYDGTAYLGFQRQSDETPTIQGMVERALTGVTQQPVAITAAGRTDTGVHATGQVIAFEVEWAHGADTLLRALNATLPDDIALQAIAVCDAAFHPRFSARSRLYGYTILQAAQRQPLLRHRAWHVHKTLDLDAMQQAASLLLGEHDFATFGQPPQGEVTIRTVFRSEWSHHPQTYGALLVYRVEANAFLQHMVRRVVGMLVEVGRGALTTGDFATAFRAANIALAKTMAPPQGLVLEAVSYNDA